MMRYTAFYDMDANCVIVWMADRSIVTIDCQKVEDAFTDNMYERSELDYHLTSQQISLMSIEVDENSAYH